MATTEEIREEIRLLAERNLLSILSEKINPYVYSVRLGISENCFVQLYFNVYKEKFLMAVVKEKERIYGFDRLDEDCHEHPVENSEKHIKNRAAR